MDDVVQAMYISFAVFMLVLALSLSVFMFSQVSSTAEVLTFYTDSTIYYNNIKLYDTGKSDPEINRGLVRVVSAETIVPTLYRYYKENFCIKIYDESDRLIQLFDVNTEGLVNNAISDTKARASSTDPNQIRNYAYKKIYNYYDKADESTLGYYMYGAPWIGSTKSIIERINLFVKGTAGFVNNSIVDYSLKNNKQANKFFTNFQVNRSYKERFISYSYSGDTITSSEGDQLVVNNSSKDKIVIVYKLLNNDEFDLK